jgi:hypothetical protein
MQKSMRGSDAPDATPHAVLAKNQLEICCSSSSEGVST